MSSVSASSSGRVLPPGATDSGFSEGSSSKSRTQTQTRARTATHERSHARINKAHDLMSSAMIATARNEGSSLGIESITILPRGSVVSRDPKRRATDAGDDSDRRGRKRRRALTGPGADEGVVGAHFKLVGGRATSGARNDADDDDEADEDEDDQVYLEITSQRSPSGSGRARTTVYDRRVPIEVEMASRRQAPPSARLPSPATSHAAPRQHNLLPPWLEHQLALTTPLPRAPGPRRPVQPADQPRPPVPVTHPFVPPTPQPSHYNPYLRGTLPGHRSPNSYPSPLPFSTSGRVSPTPSIAYAPPESLYESQMSQIGLGEYQRRFSTQVDHLPLRAPPPRYSQPMPQRYDAHFAPSPRYFAFEDPFTNYSPLINYSPRPLHYCAPRPPPARDLYAPQLDFDLLAHQDWQQGAHSIQARSRSPSTEVYLSPNRQSFPPHAPVVNYGSDELDVMAQTWDSRSRESDFEAQSLVPTPRDLYAERLLASASESFPSRAPAPTVPLPSTRPLQLIPTHPQPLEGSFHSMPNPFVRPPRLETPLPFLAPLAAPPTLERSPSPALPPTALSIPSFGLRPPSFKSLSPPLCARTPHRSRPASAPPLLGSARKLAPVALETLFEEELLRFPEGRKAQFGGATCVVGKRAGTGEYDWATQARTRVHEREGWGKQGWREQEELEPASADDDDSDGRSPFAIWEDPADPIEDV